MASTTAHAHSHEQTIRPPGSYEVSSGVKGLLVFFVLLGAAVFALGLSLDAKRTWAAFLLGHFYFMSLALGGLFVAAIQWLTSAMWSAPVRRIAESCTAYLPVALITTVALYFGLHHLYTWTDLTYVKGDAVLSGKSGYLNPGFFMLRNVLIVLLWIFFAKIMVGRSLKQDETKDPALTLKNRALSPVFLIVFTLSYTLSSFDQIMSLDPHWYSTMFGVYCFAGLFYAALALNCLGTLWLQSKGKLDGIVNDNHLHDMGKFMFAFTVFWAYIAFAQFMLIWYANLPEETEYFIRRFHGCWMYVSVFLLLGKFVLPFLVLLPRGAKRVKRTLAWVAVWMLVSQWIDVIWMVQPEFFPEGPHIGWIEIGVNLMFLGVFLLCVTRFFAKHSVVAIGDPRLAEAVFQHQV